MQTFLDQYEGFPSGSYNFLPGGGRLFVVFFSVGPRGDQIFLGSKRGGPKFLSRYFFLAPLAQFLLRYIITKNFRAFGATFLFTIPHVIYHVHI